MEMWFRCTPPSLPSLLELPTEDMRVECTTACFGNMEEGYLIHSPDGYRTGPCRRREDLRPHVRRVPGFVREFKSKPLRGRDKDLLNIKVSKELLHKVAVSPPR